MKTRKVVVLPYDDARKLAFEDIFASNTCEAISLSEGEYICPFLF